MKIAPFGLVPFAVRALRVSLLASAASVFSCNSTPVAQWDCSNAECTCLSGSDCEFSCASPPCHVACETGSTCLGQCADATCTCEPGASCSFQCTSPPCQVDCQGSNAACDGVCADGMCTCENDSNCSFVCDSPPCHASCASGARCTMQCPAGLANDPGGDCQFDSCAAGTVTVCGDRITLACNAACPG